MSDQTDKLLSTHEHYANSANRWQYLLESYVGGETYRNGQHLTKYQDEPANEYAARLQATPLDNHCNSVISVYNSFLFREAPQREFGSLNGTQEVNAFLADADLDGRSLNNFMKDVATWASVYGHCWIMLAKPNTNANTRADELDQEVRPYANILSPLTVTDWSWIRQPNGLYILDYLKYVENVSGDLRTIKEWTAEVIKTSVVDIEKGEVIQQTLEDNQLNKIPAVIAYNQRGTVRGIGVSDINDIADAQRYLYNCNSEIEQSIRIDSHPSLVKTKDTEAGVGPGSIIEVEETIDPALKPYILEFNGASISSVLSTKDNIVEVIDKMANTGAVRATESRTLSGVAMQTEFQLLNAKLSEKADNLELAEEQLWRLFALYQGKGWDGTIEYPGSFNIQDISNEFAQLQTAKSASTNTGVQKLIDKHIVELLGEDPDTILTNDNNIEE